MPNPSACSFFLGVMVHMLCVMPIPHLSYYFGYCKLKKKQKLAKETQTSNYILEAWRDRGQVIRALGEAILLKVGLALAVRVSTSLWHSVLGTRDSHSLYLGVQILPKTWTFVTGIISADKWRLHNFLKMWNDEGNFVLLNWANQTVQRVSKFRDKQRLNVIGFSPWIYFFFSPFQSMIIRNWPCITYWHH